MNNISNYIKLYFSKFYFPNSLYPDVLIKSKAHLITSCNFQSDYINPIGHFIT